MTEIIPDANGGGEEVKLSKKEYDELVESVAKKAQAEASLLEEVTNLRKKNQELSKVEPKPEEVQKLVDAEFKKRELEETKKASELALNEFLDNHPEFNKENDTDGSKFAAFQKALARINLSGVKSKDDYTQVLNDALILTGQVNTPSMQNYSSSPRSVSEPRFSPPGHNLTSPEQKLVQNNFGGNVEAYLKVKSKRPEYVEELLRWVR